MNLATSMQMEIRGTATDTADMADTAPRAVLLAQFIDSLTNGTGLDNANQVYADSGAIGAAATVDIDLAGTVTDVFGNTITFANIKAIFVKNTSTTGAVINLGGGSNAAGLNAFDTWITSTAADGSEAIILPQNAAVLLWNPIAAGYVVTAGTIDLLSMTETATLVGAYELMVVGEA